MAQTAGTQPAVPSGTSEEDPSHRSGPSTDNLAIAILRLTGHASIAAALRYHACQPGRPLQTIMQC